MCLITRQQKPLIAENDIPCFKLVRLDSVINIIKSPYNDFQWTPNTVYETKLVEELDRSESIVCFDEMVASEYFNDCWSVNERYEKKLNHNLISIGKGFHGMMKKDRHRPEWVTDRIVNAIIPK